MARVRPGSLDQRDLALLNEAPRAFEGDAESASVTIEGHALELARLNKVFWPETKGVRAFTKRDYLAYLLRAARPIVAHLAARPLTLLLMPDGLGGRRVLEMHWAREVPAFVDTVEIFSGNKGGPHRYLLCNNRASLLWLANVGVLEFHPWHSRITRGADAKGAGVEFTRSLADLERSVLERPDYIVFDIDSYMYSGREQPGAEPEYHRAAFEKCKQAALRMREMLERASFNAVVKTSGKTGLHVLAPIERSIDFAMAREVSRTVCEQLVRERPRDYTMTWGVKDRSGRIFLDYGMNARAKSLAAPYCPRAVPGTPVSMPVPWEILADLEPRDYRIDTALEVLNRSGDAWGAIDALKVRIGRPATEAEAPQRERSLHR
jgi:bifunctional non-homologous end joining protein LigD